jgi:3-dehydroquinate synthase
MGYIERTIQVSYRHRVYFTRDVFAAQNPLLKQVLATEKSTAVAKTLVVVDETLAERQPHLLSAIEQYFAQHAADLKLACAPMVIEGGERAKNSLPSRISRTSAPHRPAFVYHRGSRRALLDVVGLAAYGPSRVRLVRIPTTTLSQDDSGVGVKNGINAFGKNFIGTLRLRLRSSTISPWASLPDRDQRAGYIEAVKVALIRDSAFFNKSSARRARAAFEPEPCSVDFPLG